MDTIKVKAKPGFNIVVKDLGLSLRSETKDWIEVDKEKFDASVDIRSVRKLILIEGEDVIAADAVIADEKKEVEVKVTGEGAFVIAGQEEKKPEGIFVAQPKTSPEANTTAILDQAPVPAPKAKVLDETEVVEQVVEPTVEPAAEVKETVVEAKEVKEEATKPEKSKAETKPATKKPATRTKTDKKTK